VTTTTVDEKREGQQFWDANPCGGEWASYTAFAEWYSQTEPYAFNVLAGHSWDGRRVLEVGCGQGVVLNHLARKRADAFGVDMSIVSITRTRQGAAELGAQVHLSLSDAESLPFPNQSFDAVVSFGVLHHTPDTPRAVQEVHRVLKPGGTAIVMLYRTGNPKWWATSSIRAFSRAVDRASRRSARVANSMRSRRERDDSKGTALLELFGVPTMQAFSNAEARRMFHGFSRVEIRNYSPGFKRLADMSPVLRPLSALFGWIDRSTETGWGFYQVIEATR
jgi:ubiquinone/menaquinone biosynthesis C-methylase UbiE